MDKQFIVYIESLLSEREREIKSLQDRWKKHLARMQELQSHTNDPELAMTIKQESEWELGIIAESQKALKNLNQQKKSYPRRPSLRETQAMQARNRGGY